MVVLSKKSILIFTSGAYTIKSNFLRNSVAASGNLQEVVPSSQIKELSRMDEWVGYTWCHTLIVCWKSLHLKIVISIVQHLIVASFVVYGEGVNLTIVRAWHLVLWTPHSQTSSRPAQRVSLTSISYGSGSRLWLDGGAPYGSAVEAFSENYPANISTSIKGLTDVGHRGRYDVDLRGWYKFSSFRLAHRRRRKTDVMMSFMSRRNDVGRKTDVRKTFISAPQIDVVSTSMTDVCWTSDRSRSVSWVKTRPGPGDNGTAWRHDDAHADAGPRKRPSVCTAYRREVIHSKGFLSDKKLSKQNFGTVSRLHAFISL